MKNRKIAIILATIVLVISVIGIAFTKGKSTNKETSNSTFSENQDDNLLIQTEAEISNPEDAYKAAIFYIENFKASNKDKLTSESIKEIHIVIKGKYKSWLYDGTGNVKEIDLK